MKTELLILDTQSTDPYRNLALEELLLHRVRAGQVILYLWQNKRTVVIGKNQNAVAECNIPALEADGGHLARRLSGGGAVYHDLGNLNFTFLMQRELFDVSRQTDVILRALKVLGIHAEKNGRNDLTVNGSKFSGHAYYHTGGKSYHHGTLMVHVDQECLSRYLRPSPLKLQAKGVPSVRSRVVNLQELLPSLSIPDLKAALADAYSAVYGAPVARLREEAFDQEELMTRTQAFASRKWLLGPGAQKAYEHSREARFSWGTARLDYNISDGILTDVALWSDGLEADYLEQIPRRLSGCPLREDALQTAIGTEAMAKDLISMVLPERGVTHEI